MNRFPVWMLLVLSVLAPTLSAAAPGSTSSADAKAAVELAKQAKDKYDQGEWRGALELFEAADAKAHSPVIVLHAARCYRNLGELVAARQLLEQVADEPLGPAAPQQFAEAKTSAAADLVALEARIPTLVIDRGAAPASWIVKVDGVVMSEAAMLVDPGRHQIKAGPAGKTEFEREVVLGEGSRVTVTVEAPATTPPDPVMPTSPAASEPDGGFGSSVGPGLIALGLGAVGVGVGVGLRVAALNKVADVKDRCVGNQCLAEDEAEVESAETLQTASSVLFVIGGALMATGVVLMIALPDDEGASLALTARPGWVGFQGSF